MPIRLLLQDEVVFSPEDIPALTTAFENVLSDLGLADRDDPAVTMVAKYIIEFAKDGERDPILLRDHVLNLFQARSRL